MTAALAVLGGGLWALWRYTRQKPDLPRVNPSVSASLEVADGVDYVSFEATVAHIQAPHFRSTKAVQGNERLLLSR